jgi:DNA-binding NarL/FixJ family response regulator
VEDTIDEVQTVTVLIVDDQPPFRAVARTVVDLAPGFEVVGEAESGEEAIQWAAALAPAVVLMDINLPGVNGVEATRRIVEHATDTVVILLSTYDADSLPAGAEGSGAARYVHKEDFSPVVLQEVWAARAEGNP